MATELGLQAYVCFGNLLHYVTSRADLAERLDSRPEAIAALYAAVEPLTPTNILARVSELPAEQVLLLRRIGMWCLGELETADFESRIGLTKDEAAEVLRSPDLAAPDDIPPCTPMA